MVLLVPAVLGVRRLAAGRIGAWFDVLSVLALAGIAVLVAGQLLLVTGLMSLQLSFATLSIGLLAFVAWGGGVAFLALQRGVLSRAVGRWAVTFAVALVLAAIGWAVLSLAAWSILGVALLIAFVGWLVSLGWDLRTRSRHPLHSGTPGG